MGYYEWLALLILFVFLATLAIAVGYFFLQGHLTSPSSFEIEQQAIAFRRRLLSADFAAIEKHFGSPVPTCLRALYEAPHEILQTDFEVAESEFVAKADRWYVAFFEPADVDALHGNPPELKKFFTFATDGRGNPYVIDVALDDPLVRRYDLETGELEDLNVRLSQFLKLPRCKS